MSKKKNNNLILIKVPEAQSNRSTSLRDYFRKVRLLNTINRILTHNEGEHLKDTENFETVVFSSPFDVPYLWAKTDYKGRKAVCKSFFFLNRKSKRDYKFSFFF